jgi:hypothetical protein
MPRPFSSETVPLADVLIAPRPSRHERVNLSAGGDECKARVSQPFVSGQQEYRLPGRKAGARRNIISALLRTGNLRLEDFIEVGLERARARSSSDWLSRLWPTSDLLVDCVAVAGRCRHSRPAGPVPPPRRGQVRSCRPRPGIAAARRAARLSHPAARRRHGLSDEYLAGRPFSPSRRRGVGSPERRALTFCPSTSALRRDP